MNIEEERKAFEDQCSSVLPSTLSAKWDGVKYVSKYSNAKPYLQACFEVWLKAKAHAEEMAKPAAEVYERMDGKFWAVKAGSRNNVCENGSTFDSYQDAVACAVERGYRVAEDD